MRGSQTRGFKRLRRPVWAQKPSHGLSVGSPRRNSAADSLQNQHLQYHGRSSLPPSASPTSAKVRPAPAQPAATSKVAAQTGPERGELKLVTPRLDSFQDEGSGLANPDLGRRTPSNHARLPRLPAQQEAGREVYRAEALALRTVDLSQHRPSAPLLDQKPARFWLRHEAIPWVQLGDTIAIAFATATEAESQKQELTECFGPIIPVLAPRHQITPLLQRHFRTAMARRASASIAPELSTRTLFQHSKRLKQLLPVTSVLTLAVVFPIEVFAISCGMALVFLVLFSALKTCGLLAHLTRSHRRRKQEPMDPGAQPPQPMISVLVPLYKEAAISTALLKRLKRLDYPRNRLQVLLVLEEGDGVTRQALLKTRLPPWIEAIEVPAWGELRTKPRAMNYALNFCRGEIVGVWDAEDAPQPDQLQKVATAFATAPAQVACFQGVLDYYNPRANVISRLFTLEYASWFRIVLQGIARLGLVVPLGGTTMFVRRSVLDQLGGWDSHNVTEDADLGVRLYRAGFRTQMLPSATYEEASCHLAAWIRQRSRWIKGFMATYLVHMRQPLRLARDIGLPRFLGFQAFFLGTIGQFLLAPFLWTYWAVILGLPHASTAILPNELLYFALSTLIGFETLG
ncbi:glycosyltransferase, partial [Pseudophaeobacter sp.]|uniref:glycosyltransferase n=1 Tax=Pseudophaeobacter sp. TaxID=1971739 RepID=UPI003299731B